MLPKLQNNLTQPYLTHRETLLITHHLQLEPRPTFGAYSSSGCVRCQQHCGSTTWWVMVCMRVMSRSVSFHLVPAVPDPRRGCLHHFLELPDSGLMRGATPVAFKNFTVDCPTKPRQPTSTGYTWHFQLLSSIWFFRSWYFVAFLSWAHSMLASHGTVSSASITERSVSDHITINIICV